MTSAYYEWAEMPDINDPAYDEMFPMWEPTEADLEHMMHSSTVIDNNLPF